MTEQQPTTPMTREELAARIMALPEPQRAQAILAAQKLYGAKKGKLAKRRGPSRDAAQRRALFGDPWKYFADILGWQLTPQQENALAEIEKRDRVLIAAANNVGKTWMGSGYAVYRMDAHGAQPDEARGLAEQGAMVLLPGPDHGTIFSTIYRELLMHLRRALSRGFGMPGQWSENSVLWRARPDWYVEAFAPPEHVGQDVAHTVSGRHHQNMMAILEEGQGIRESVWRAVEGMCSGAGNKIISPFNPTEAHGSAFSRARSGSYFVLHLDAFGHPNVRERRSVIPAAIAHTTIDQRVRDDCRDRGPYPDVQPDPERRDFVYALPPTLGAEERGGREDGTPGHPDGAPRVYRPSGVFQGQVLGQWPDETEAGLFDPSSVDAAIARWKASPEPTSPPDRLGLDCAREGNDENVGAPAWGDGAETLLRAWAEARLVSSDAVAEIVATRRARVGTPVLFGKGKGPEIAERVAARFQRSPWNVDDGGPGASVLDHGEILGMDVTGVSFGGAPPDPTPGEPYSENLRTAMYVRAALMHARGLVDTPDDPLLREELLAHKLIHKTKSVKVIGDDGTERKELRACVLLIAKDDVKKLIGRSPDRADAYVLALYEPARTKADEWEVW